MGYGKGMGGDGPEMRRVCTRRGCGQVRKQEREEGNAFVRVERWTRTKRKEKKKKRTTEGKRKEI